MNDIILYIVLGLIGVGLVFAVIRFLKGPNVSDRAVSLDTINIIVIGLITLLSFLFDNSLFLDIAIVYAILAFLETIVYARYVEGRHEHR